MFNHPNVLPATRPKINAQSSRQCHKCDLCLTKLRYFVMDPATLSR